jgi:hypothetical protein
MTLIVSRTEPGSAEALALVAVCFEKRIAA